MCTLLWNRKHQRKSLRLKRHSKATQRQQQHERVAEVQRELWVSPQAAHICLALDIKNNADCSCLHLWEGEVALRGRNYKQKCVMCLGFDWFMLVQKKADIYDQLVRQNGTVIWKYNIVVLLRVGTLKVNLKCLWQVWNLCKMACFGQQYERDNHSSYILEISTKEKLGLKYLYSEFISVNICKEKNVCRK